MKRITDGQNKFDFENGILTVFNSKEPTFHLLVPARLLSKEGRKAGWKGEIVLEDDLIDEEPAPLQLPVSVFVWSVSLGQAFGGRVEVNIFKQGRATGRVDIPWVQQLRKGGAQICMNFDAPPVEFIRLPFGLGWLAALINWHRHRKVAVPVWKCTRVLHQQGTPATPKGWRELETAKPSGVMADAN